MDGWIDQTKIVKTARGRKMGIRRMATVQVVSTFLTLATASSLAAREIEYNDGPSLTPSESESDIQRLCSCASLLALHGLDDVSQALTDLKAQPSET